jgi:hypothetical protein
MSFADHSYTSTYSIACICIPNLVLSGKKIKRNKLCAIIHYRLNNFVQYFQVLSASNFTATMLTGCLSWCTDQIHGQRLYSILHHLSPVLHDDNVNFHLFFAVAQMSSIIFSWFSSRCWVFILRHGARVQIKRHQSCRSNSHFPQEGANSLITHLIWQFKLLGRVEGC